MDGGAAGGDSGGMSNSEPKDGAAPEAGSSVHMRQEPATPATHEG